jgi:CRISPR/Cas system CSM-associated protein Csm3 (group 7 of RAMP superfamily)
MPNIALYDQITKYVVHGKCKEPLHIGSAVGSREEVLIHPVDGQPFMQASSLAGAFRNCCQQLYGTQETEKLFGTSKGAPEEGDVGSRVRFCDGTFSGPIHLELRPRVSIDRKTGTCASSQIKGTSIQSGHKFNVEYIGAGVQVQFVIYLYGGEKREQFETLFASVQNHDIRFGGQKSNGCGCIQITKLQRKIFDMTVLEDRKSWVGEQELDDRNYEELDLSKIVIKQHRTAYKIEVKAQTESELLVKGIATDSFGENAPDAVNMRNANGKFIIPGSSLKGAMRSQMEKIANYLGVPQVIENTFGKAGADAERGQVGNICFFDTVVEKPGSQKQKGQKPEDQKPQTFCRHRIHIDKFTGGVMQGGLFYEQNVFGVVTLRISIDDRQNPDQSCGLLVLALRDLSVHMMNLGSGYNVGKGFLQVEKIRITNCRTGDSAVIHPSRTSNAVEDQTGIITNCLQSLKRR